MILLIQPIRSDGDFLYFNRLLFRLFQEKMESHYLKLRSDANDNDDINEVVKVWIERSKNIALKDVPYEIFEVIGSYFPPQQNWKKFAACLGVSNLHELRVSVFKKLGLQFGISVNIKLISRMKLVVVTLPLNY